MMLIHHRHRRSHAIRVKRCKDAGGHPVEFEVCFRVTPTGRVAEADAEEVHHG